MISVNIICVGKLKSYFKEGCAEYYKRLSPFCRLGVFEIAEERLPEAPSEKQIKAALSKEGGRICEKIPAGSYVIAMCIEGRELSSMQFSQKLEDLKNTHSSVTFIIGSSFGLADSVIDRADFLLSLGKMTLPHQLARLVLAEQIYRAFSISTNMKYHK
ncbi:MAG: 23S rRNA (pseudouridine(1915)-N(3))-methyltransferase RlmH [Clostridiales bacterium]|nr:23S rRNA (pseudouridine(1915)-N(3))-methyltransferase RlmH [Clostridiales bacterium]